MLRLAPDRKYAHSGERPVLPGPGDKDSPRAVLDLYSRLRAVASNGAAAVGGGEGKRLAKLGPGHVALFDRTRMHDKLLARKRQRGWHNLSIEPDIVDRLFAEEKGDWYELYAPPEKLDATGFRQMRALEDIAVDLVTEYADQFWRKRRRRWEHEQIEVVALTEADPNNVEAWELSVDATEARLIEDIHRLTSHVREGSFDYRGLDLRVILAKAHAWQPLLAWLPPPHAGKDRKVTVQPVPLDESEAKVVEGLAALAERGDPCLSGRELFLIRNRTHGRGVSFFDDFQLLPRLHRLAQGRRSPARRLPRSEGTEPLRREGTSQGEAAPRDRGGREAGARHRPSTAPARLCTVGHGPVADRRRRALRGVME